MRVGRFRRDYRLGNQDDGGVLPRPRRGEHRSGGMYLGSFAGGGLIFSRGGRFFVVFSLFCSSREDISSIGGDGFLIYAADDSRRHAARRHVRVQIAHGSLLIVCCLHLRVLYSYVL